MDYLAIMNSGNYVLSLCRKLEKKGYVFEVVSTPCQIARDGCGYCLKFPKEYKDIIFEEARASNIVIKEVFKIVPMFSKNRYEKVY